MTDGTTPKRTFLQAIRERVAQFFNPPAKQAEPVETERVGKAAIQAYCEEQYRLLGSELEGISRELGDFYAGGWRGKLIVEIFEKRYLAGVSLQTALEVLRDYVSTHELEDESERTIVADQLRHIYGLMAVFNAYTVGH